MKQLTKQEVEAVVEILADKTLSFGCMIVDKNHSPSKIMFVENGIGQTYSGIQIGAENTYNFFNGYMTPEMKVLGHPITIGTVLDYAIRQPGGLSKYLKEKIMDTWFNFKLSTSLQEIIEESGWECKLVAQESDTSIRKVEILTSPEANALFNFLQEIL